MAEAFAGLHAGEDVHVYSAGLESSRVHPHAVEVMAELDIDISAAASKDLDALGHVEFDLVITLCDVAAQSCPLFPGNPARVDWNLPDPDSVEGDSGHVLQAFRDARDRIGTLVADLFERGYIDALVHAKGHANLILSNLFEGVIAHDFQRRIFHFNEAAERITGCRRADVIGKDCHDVFPGGFCGKACDFCEDSVSNPPDLMQRTINITSQSGGSHTVEMSIKTMRDAQGVGAGVLLSFRDCTEELNLKRRLEKVEQFSGIIGRDSKMLEVFDLIRDVADSNVTVLIQGESGTGKELVAAAIHREGVRGSKLFVPVNCGALPENLLESELFGHVRGAFTGAIRDKKGRFELAHRGTIFLDEIGDISPAMQVKLLRVLQEGSFERVGGEKTIQADVRVISATNKDLRKEVVEGRFREDLFYRLNVMPVLLSPLRERRHDIPLLAKHLLMRVLDEGGSQEGVQSRRRLRLSSGAIDEMLTHDWPGNVRELQNWIQFALIKCKGEEIQREHLPSHRRTHSLPNASTVSETPARGRRGPRKKLSADAVEAALTLTGGNKVAAARELGVGRATLYRFLDAQGSKN